MLKLQVIDLRKVKSENLYLGQVFQSKLLMAGQLQSGDESLMISVAVF